MLTLIISGLKIGYKISEMGIKRDGDISWTMTSRGHYFSKWVTSRGHSQEVTFRGHFW